MALYHVKSNPISDFTGTVTVLNSAGSTATKNATDLVRPSDWNSAHNLAMTLSGNTAGQSTFSGTNVVYQGGNNVTLSASTAAGAATVVFSAANQTNQTQASGNIAGVGTTFGGTNVSASMTLNSNGLALSLSAPAGGGGGANTLSTIIPYYPASTAASTLGATGTSTASAHFWPVSIVQPVNFNELRLLQTMSMVSSSVAGSQTITSNYGIYSNNAGTLSQISSGSFSMAYTGSSVSGTLSFPTGTGTAGYTYGTVSASTTAQAQSLYGTAGNRIVGLQFGNTMQLTEGLYWIGVHQRMSSSSANVGLVPALAGNVFLAAQNAGPIGSSTAAMTGGANALQYKFGWGPYTSTGSAGYSGTNLPVSAFMSGIANTVTQMPMCTFIKT
jgi:hypothetical protein